MKRRIVAKLVKIGKHYESPLNLSLFSISKMKNKKNSVWLFKNISLTIREGDRIGIIGPNGAGKTTMFKILAGIAQPTTGKVISSKKIVTLMNLEAGFDLDLTGEENMYLNGMLVGMTRSEIRKKKNSIIKFSGIGNFINAPFYTYSAGMKFRLACSIALASQCDLLIIDEILISGDIDFQKKILSGILEIQKKTNISTIICSHNPQTLWAFAETFYLLDKGSLKLISKAEIKKLGVNYSQEFHQIFKTSKLFELNKKLS